MKLYLSLTMACIAVLSFCLFSFATLSALKDIKNYYISDIDFKDGANYELVMTTFDFVGELIECKKISDELELENIKNKFFLAGSYRGEGTYGGAAKYLQVELFKNNHIIKNIDSTLHLRYYGINRD